MRSGTRIRESPRRLSIKQEIFEHFRLIRDNLQWHFETLRCQILRMEDRGSILFVNLPLEGPVRLHLESSLLNYLFA